MDLISNPVHSFTPLDWIPKIKYLCPNRKIRITGNNINTLATIAIPMSLDFDENTPFLDDKLKRLSDKIKQLKTAITQSSVNSQTPSTPTNPITAKDLLITEYDDMLTARIIEKIIVKSRQDLEIIFIGGYTQQISLQ